MLARHLILQGFKTDQVTILTTYTAQLLQFRSVSELYNTFFQNFNDYNLYNNY